MPIATEEYLRALERMVNSRERAGSDWTQEDEARAAEECDRLWWEMSREEQDEAEAKWPSLLRRDPARTATTRCQKARFAPPFRSR